MGYNNHLSERFSRSIVTVDQWREFINAGRSKISRPCANNTTARLINDGQDVAIRLHDTDIITYNSDGTLTLNSGGWRSVTTKERINRYTHAGISQKMGVWYMGDGSLFYDGITIETDGKVLEPRGTEKYEKQLAAIKRRAKTYARNYVEALKAGKVDMPSAGDCWACLMRGPKGQEAFSGSNHLQSHMDQKYYVPTLLVNAGREAGYRDEQIGLMGIGGRRVFIEPERVIYRYMVKHLQREL